MVSYQIECSFGMAAKKRPLDPRLDLRRHSSSGFAWGKGNYNAAPAHQLALALVADALRNDQRAAQLHERFSRRVVTLFPQRWKLCAAAYWPTSPGLKKRLKYPRTFLASRTANNPLFIHSTKFGTQAKPRRFAAAISPFDHFHLNGNFQGACCSWTPEESQVESCEHQYSLSAVPRIGLEEHEI